MDYVTPTRTGIDADPRSYDSKAIQEGTPEHRAFNAVRAQYDRVLQATGSTPYYPTAECKTPNDYRRQLLATIAPHTQTYKGTNARAISDEGLAHVEAKIIADAMQEPRRLGVLREIRTKDRSGRDVLEFVGDSGWFRSMKGPVSVMTGLVTKTDEHGRAVKTETRF